MVEFRIIKHIYPSTRPYTTIDRIAMTKGLISQTLHQNALYIPGVYDGYLTTDRIGMTIGTNFASVASGRAGVCTHLVIMNI